MDKWEWNNAESEIKRALELNSNFERAHRVCGKYLLIHGRLEDAVAESNRARELNPLGASANQQR
jgi:Flp pilus assembly protein TadD